MHSAQLRTKFLNLMLCIGGLRCQLRTKILNLLLCIVDNLQTMNGTR